MTEDSRTNDSVKTPENSRVFVVHGRNVQARSDVFSFLRAIGLKPIEWSQATKMTGKGTPFIGEILDAAFEQAQAVVVLLTGDDEARLRVGYRKDDEPNFESALTPQARPNVLFEAGMAFGRYPNRTILVQLGQLRQFSDVAGRHAIHLNNSTQQRQELAQRLTTAGCRVDLTGTDWHNVGDFDVGTDPSPVEHEPDDVTGEATTAKLGLHHDAIEILKLSAESVAWIKKEPIRKKLNMNGYRFKHFLDVLCEEEFLKDVTHEVLLLPKGSKFLIDNDLI